MIKIIYSNSETMRNNKKLTVILAILLVMIWGGVVMEIQKHVPVYRKIEQKDSFPVVPVVPIVERRLLNGGYDDPFLGRKSKNKPLVQKEKIKQIPLCWPAMDYLGYLKGQRKRRMGIVQQEGKIHFVREGDHFSGIRIRLLTEEYILIEQKGVKKKMKRKKN